MNPKRGECMLWQFSSMGRLATTRGIWGASRQVSVMAEMAHPGPVIVEDPLDNPDLRAHNTDSVS